jgi:thiol-disulfide isomerase/thioredoxin
MKKTILFFSFLFLAFAAFAWDPLVDFNGQQVSYDDLIAKPKTIIFLWATWCPYCREEMKYLNKNDSLYSDIEIIYWNVGEDKAKVGRVVEALKIKDSIKKNIVLDIKSVIADKFPIVGFPTFLFFKNGKFAAAENYLDQDLVKSVFGTSDR